MGIVPQDNTLRKCINPDCKNPWLPITSEYFHSNGKGGLQTRCKECKREQAKAYKKRPEVQEKRRIYGEAYNSRPDVRERRKAYYQVYNHTYYNRPDVRVRSQAYGNRQRARKRALGTYTPVQIQEKLKAQKYRCYYCSIKFNKKKDGKYIYHIDHTFPLSRVVGTDIPANSIDYLVLACPSCNMSKRNKYPWEWPQGGRLL